MPRPRIVVTSSVPGTALDTLRAAADVVVLSEDGNVDNARLREALTTADGVLSMLTDRLDADTLSAAPHLRVVGNCAVGFDNVDTVAATARGIQVCNTPDVLTDATADLAFALLLAVARKITEADRYVRAGSFERWQMTAFLGTRVHGSTLGIVGLGRIGRAVAKRGRGFEQRIVYTQRHRAETRVEEALGARYVRLEELLVTSDFVSIHVPLTPETRNLLGAAALGKMKPTAVLVNTGRGPVVDEAALAEALRAGKLAGAGLDVYEHEPKIHAGLLSLPNVVLTPHIGSATHETRCRMADAVASDILRVLRGEPPMSPVNTLPGLDAELPRP